MNARRIDKTFRGLPASDGDGVRLTRIIGPHYGLDPFLLLDNFDSLEPRDYIGGFPPHPHRGFETVTYMLEGRMLHEDHLGNRGDLGPGDVQWMTAAKGIIHSEMPQQERGRMRGFQLWLNLPGREKLKDAAYRDIPAGEMPWTPVTGGRVKVVAGEVTLEGQAISGPVTGATTDPLYLDLDLEAGARLTVPVAEGHRVLLYPYEGSLQVAGKELAAGLLGVLGEGEVVDLTAGPQGLRGLLLAAKPLGEPVAHYGPFVMNTAEEIQQALRDYREGRLTA